MTRFIHRRSELMLMVIATTIVMACDGQARGRRMDGPVPMIDQVLDQVRAAAKLDLGVVERTAGATLREAEGSNGAFVFYRASGVRSGSHTLAIDLRVPRPGGGATAGPLLVVDVAGSCINRASMEERFGPLTLTGVPRGDSRDEKAYWSRSEKWGQLSFGFSERDPRCLASVVFRVGAG